MLLLRSREFAGRVVGGALAPALWSGTRLRHARVFHPVGTAFTATVTPRADAGVLGALAQRLSGHAVLRFSGGIWKRQDRTPDLLGCAIRFCSPARALAPSGDDQDLVMATLRLPWTLGAAILATDAEDFLRNDFYGASPFRVDGLGTIKLRLRPTAPSPEGHDRVQRLLRAVEARTVRLVLELKPHLRPVRWTPIVEIHVQAPLDAPPERLRFDPFRDGRGLRPAGFIQAMRRPAYRLSHRGWPAADS